VSSIREIGTAAAAGNNDAAMDVQVEQPVGTPRQFPCFDGLRAIAVVLVLLLHTAWVSGFTLRSSLGIYAGRLEIGVSIFFLISGFLLYRPFVLSHLTGERSPNSRRFWQRRLLRIVPAYWLALTLLTYVFHLVSLGPGWQGVVTHYLFLQIYFPAQVFFGITQAWSLCTEMSFYLVLPLYAWVVRRTSRVHRSPQVRLVRELVGVGVLLVISFVFRYWVLHRPLITVSHGKFVALCAPNCATRPTLATLMVDWLPAYLDLFALGMLLAILSVWFAEHRSEPRWLQHRLMPWVSWLLAAVSYWAVSHVVNDPSILYFVKPHVNLERQTLYGIFALLIIAPAVFGPQDRSLIRRLLRSWPMAGVGVISYGIYLWHLNLIFQFLDWTGWRPGTIPFWLLALAVFALSAAVASVSYFGLERPILRVKRRMSWWDRGGREGSPHGDSAADGAGTVRSPDAPATVPDST
jgi:peptidoglycan/LPS O-acetylase OafA/YrhL